MAELAKFMPQLTSQRKNYNDGVNFGLVQKTQKQVKLKTQTVLIVSNQ